MTDCIIAYINDIGCDTLGLAMYERPNIPTAEMRYDEIYVPGRDGSLNIEQGYADVTYTLPFNVLEDENIKPLVREIKQYLMRGEKLHFSDDPLFYRIIKKVSIEDIGNEIAEYGIFNANLVLDPFEYATTTAQSISSGGTLTNPSMIPSRPMITIQGSGDGVLKINNQELKIINQTETITLDSYLQIAYVTGNVSANHKVRGSIPVLESGLNTITFSGGITSVSINPQWRYL